MPENMLRALNKVSQSLAFVDGVKEDKRIASRSPSIKLGLYEPLNEADIPDILREDSEEGCYGKVITPDDEIEIANSTRERVVHFDDETDLGISSVIVDVEVHESKETQPSSS